MELASGVEGTAGRAPAWDTRLSQQPQLHFLVPRVAPSPLSPTLCLISLPALTICLLA